MKSLLNYINEAQTRVLITLNEKNVDGKEVIISAGNENKFFKGNKNNVAKIKIQLQTNTKCDWDIVKNIKVLEITLVDNYNDNPHSVKENEFAKINELSITHESDHYILKVYDKNNPSDDYFSMPIEKIYENTLSDIFTVKG